MIGAAYFASGIIACFLFMVVWSAIDQVRERQRRARLVWSRVDSMRWEWSIGVESSGAHQLQNIALHIPLAMQNISKRDPIPRTLAKGVYKVSVVVATRFTKMGDGVTLDAVAAECAAEANERRQLDD